MTIEELLAANGIALDSTAPGQHYAICPQCSHDRKKKTIKCLGVKIDASGVCWLCHHCGWSGPQKGTGTGTAEYSAVYNYVDADGNLLWQKLRRKNPRPNQSKFSQRKPDGHGDWIWKGVRKGLPSVLYRLPEVIAAIKAGKEITIVEGEKDADNLWKIGIPATCSPDGAAKPGQRPKWKAEHSEQLRGADVVVMGDHDDPGYMHQDVTARMLIGIAKRVRVLKLAEHWPECPKGGDVSDWLAAGHTADELLILIESASDYHSEDPPRPGSPADGGHHEQDGVSLDDFHAYMTDGRFIYVPTGQTWPATSVNAKIPPVLSFDKDGKPEIDENTGEQKELKASVWLARNRSVEQMTWAPGLPMLIRDRLINDGGWTPESGVTCFNLYKPPIVPLGDPTKASPWLDHLHKLLNDDDAEHTIKWLAQRRQHPEIKINHAVVVGGNDQGIGKDTLLEPVKHAIGPWNFADVSAQQTLGRFNGYLKSVIMRVNEARDLGDVNRYQFYDHMKAYIAAPPDVLRCDEKNLREYVVLNCTGVVLTTNHKTTGIYLPAEDRRHFVAWSERTKADFDQTYWNMLWGWYEKENGYSHVAAYLAELDITAFDPKAPPPKTNAFYDIVDANRAPEDAELEDVLDKLNRPRAVTIEQIVQRAQGKFQEYLEERRNIKVIPHRFEQCGYIKVRHPTDKKGRWFIRGRRQVIYVQSTLSVREQLQAAADLINAMSSASDEMPF